MPNSAAVSPRWNTRLIWKSCRHPLPRSGGLLLLLFACFTLLPLVASASPEAQACAESLSRPLSHQQQGMPRRLQILMWNIEKASNPGWEKDLLSLGQEANLILIQEAATRANIGAALPQRLYQAFAAGYTTADLETGVLTLSTAAPSLQCNLTAWEPWLGTPKATNITEYPVDGSTQRLLVINIHAVNFTVGLDEFGEQIFALAPLLHNHRGPLIVAGDFNTWSTNRRKMLENFMREHRLSEVTFSPDLRTRFWHKPLDHVYFRDLNLVEARAVEVETSDHNPLIFTLEVPDD